MVPSAPKPPKIVFNEVAATELEVIGDPQGAELEVTVLEIDGEKDYYVRCLCPACFQIDQVGSDAYDPNDELEVGKVYYMKSHFETIHIPMVGTEYDAWIGIHENDE